MVSVKLLDKLTEDVLQCPICCDEITTPKTLPCQHSFCRKCLERLVKTSAGSLLCPLCRMSASNDVDSLPTNFVLTKIKEILAFELQEEQQQLTSSPPETTTKSNRRRNDDAACVCDRCRQPKVDVFCHDCREYTCQDCNRPDRHVHHTIFRLSRETSMTWIVTIRWLLDNCKTEVQGRLKLLLTNVWIRCRPDFRLTKQRVMTGIGSVLAITESCAGWVVRTSRHSVSSLRKYFRANYSDPLNEFLRSIIACAVFYFTLEILFPVRRFSYECNLWLLMIIAFFTFNALVQFFKPLLSSWSQAAYEAVIPRRIDAVVRSVKSSAARFDEKSKRPLWFFSIFYVVIFVAVQWEELMYRLQLVYQYVISAILCAAIFHLIFPPGNDNDDTSPGETVQHMVAEVRATGRGRKRNVSRAANR